MDLAQADRQSVSQPLAETIGRLWTGCSAERYGIPYDTFEQWLLEIGATYHWGIPPTQEVTAPQQASFLAALKIEDLVLARACAAGNEKAWETFLTTYRAMLFSAAYGITRQDAVARDLADSLYADLFGASTRDGNRCSKLLSYTGRGSLAGWLRSVLAQRFVDEYRQSRRTVSLEDQQVELATALPAASSTVQDLPLSLIASCIGQVLASLQVEDRFLLHAYYLDQRTLAQIARLVGVHESTISRKLNRLSKTLRKQLLRHMQSAGLSRRAAEEALSADVRDLEVDVRRFLQVAGQMPFQEVKATGGEKI